ncbi:MAG: hypothetical protein B7X90_08400 [Novosphingobium sp. 17-62-19]|nr:MAG: hypothetical protein B7X90_08400 [Novosphingobium sp. 17-62-19]
MTNTTNRPQGVLRSASLPQATAELPDGLLPDNVGEVSRNQNILDEVFAPGTAVAPTAPLRPALSAPRPTGILSSINARTARQ